MRDSSRDPQITQITQILSRVVCGAHQPWRGINLRNLLNLRNLRKNYRTSAVAASLLVAATMLAWSRTLSAIHRETVAKWIHPIRAGGWRSISRCRGWGDEIGTESVEGRRAGRSSLVARGSSRDPQITQITQILSESFAEHISHGGGINLRNLLNLRNLRKNYRTSAAAASLLVAATILAWSRTLSAIHRETVAKWIHPIRVGRLVVDIEMLGVGR